MLKYALTFSLAVLGAAAHHGWSEYDAGKVLKETGTIKESGYDHPHGFVKLDTGKKVWTVILAPPSPHGVPRSRQGRAQNRQHADGRGIPQSHQTGRDACRARDRQRQDGRAALAT